MIEGLGHFYEILLIQFSFTYLTSSCLTGELTYLGLSDGNNSRFCFKYLCDGSHDTI